MTTVDVTTDQRWPVQLTTSAGQVDLTIKEAEALALRLLECVILALEKEAA